MKLRLKDDPILKEKAKPIRLFDDNLRKFAQLMLETMLKNKGIGIAAPQVGESRQLIIVWDGNKKNPPVVMANPQITKQLGEQTGKEECLSLPGVTCIVKRPLVVIVNYHDLKGKFKQLQASGLLARCICHEIDHLRGILMTEMEWT